MSNYTPEFLKRFNAKINKTDNSDDCWTWNACVAKGYGKIAFNGKMLSAHRVAYELATGKDPCELKVCHSCDNPICVNPAHLWLGTDKENAEDRTAKGRGNVIRGESHYKAKLTTPQVREIRNLHLVKGISYQELASIYGVTSSNISLIIRGEIWKE